MLNFVPMIGYAYLPQNFGKESSAGCMKMGPLTLSQTTPCFYLSAVKVFRKQWENQKLLTSSNFSFIYIVKTQWEKGKLLVEQFLLYPQYFLPL